MEEYEKAKWKEAILVGGRKRGRKGDRKKGMWVETARERCKRGRIEGIRVEIASKGGGRKQLTETEGGEL